MEGSSLLPSRPHRSESGNNKGNKETNKAEEVVTKEVVTAEVTERVETIKGAGQGCKPGDRFRDVFLHDFSFFLLVLNLESTF